MPVEEVGSLSEDSSRSARDRRRSSYHSDEDDDEADDDKNSLAVAQREAIQVG